MRVVRSKKRQEEHREARFSAWKMSFARLAKKEPIEYQRNQQLSDMAEDPRKRSESSVLSTDLPGWTPSFSIFNQEGFGTAAPGSQRRVSKSHLAEKSAFPHLSLPLSLQRYPSLRLFSPSYHSSFLPLS